MTLNRYLNHLKLRLREKKTWIKPAFSVLVKPWSAVVTGQPKRSCASWSEVTSYSIRTTNDEMLGEPPGRASLSNLLYSGCQYRNSSSRRAKAKRVPS